MGPPKLWPHMLPTATKRHVHEFQNQHVLLDGNIELMKAGIRHYKDHGAGVYTEQVNDVLATSMWWVARGILPVLGLDGARVAGKAHAHSKRAATLTHAQELLGAADQSMPPAERSKLEKKLVNIPIEYRTAIVNAHRAAGLAVVVAPFEYDPMGALSTRLGHVYAAVSADSDLLVYGAARLIRKVDYATGEVEMYTYVLCTCAKRVVWLLATAPVG